MCRAILGVLVLLTLVSATPTVTEDQVRGLITPLAGVDRAGIDKLKAMGPEVLPHLARIYSKSSEDDRAVLAWIMYSIGQKSPEARAVLLKDIETQNPRLRLQVQWALGRVSDDTEVVDILAKIMMSDENPTFRDKAACALAYDQIHLSEKQKVKLYGKLIEGLSDSKRQVRMIAIKALEIHTGQTKGFDPNGTDEDRRNSITRWKLWLDTYEKNL
ncbi:MAG: HEAT repeat domain-containing protein [Thermoanaerobaculia bacterium]